MESNWETAVEDFNENYPIEQKKTSVFIAESELHPIALLRIARELYPGEISIVINETPDQFEIIQMLQKYPGGTIPPQVVINDNIKHPAKSLNFAFFIKLLQHNYGTLFLI